MACPRSGPVQSGIDYGKRQSVSSLASRAQRASAKYGHIIKQYAGDVPYGLICTRIGHESNSNPNVVTKHGEAGLLQVWMGSLWAQTRNIADAQPRRLGKRCHINPLDPRSNLWCALADWNERGLRMKRAMPELFPVPDREFWGCVNIGMNIGAGGTRQILQDARPRAGYAMTDTLNWIERQGESFRVRFNAHPTQVACRWWITPAWLAAAESLSGLTTTGFGKPFSAIKRGGIPFVEPLAGTGAGPLWLGLGALGAWWFSNRR